MDKKKQNKQTNKKKNTEDPCMFSFFLAKKLYLLYWHKLYQQLQNYISSFNKTCLYNVFSSYLSILMLGSVCYRRRCSKYCWDGSSRSIWKKDATAEKEVEKEEEKGGGERVRRDGGRKGKSLHLYIYQGNMLNAQSK